MDNETPVAIGKREEGGGAGTLPPGGGTLGGGRFRMAPRYHSYAVYGLMSVGSISIGIWYYVHVFLCWRDAFDFSTGGRVVCAAHRGTYGALVLALIVFVSLLIELSWLGFEAEGGARPRSIRSVGSGYRSLQRRELIHLYVALAWTVVVLGVIVWLRVLSDWWFVGA